MKRQAGLLFIFSMVSFILVFIFGMVLSPLKKTWSDPEIFRNMSLFHNHFDQLCWLGAAAVGLVFYYFRDSYRGSQKILKLFTISYILGTFLFSSAFLVRALGLIMDSKVLQKGVFISMISLGGFFNVILVICGFYIVFGLISAGRALTQA